MTDQDYDYEFSILRSNPPEKEPLIDNTINPNIVKQTCEQIDNIINDYDLNELKINLEHIDKYLCKVLVNGDSINSVQVNDLHH